MSIISHLRPNIEWLANLHTNRSPAYIISLVNNALQNFTSASKGLDGGVVESVRLIFIDNAASGILRIRWRSNNRGLWKKLKRLDDRFAQLPPQADYNAPYEVEDEPFAPLPDAGRAETEIKDAAKGPLATASAPREVLYIQDGDQRCATRPDFINLQESPAGFGATDAEALDALEKAEGKPTTTPSPTPKRKRGRPKKKIKND